MRPVTFALVSANLVNWFGNWVLIYGKLGFPRLGVRGSALSTCVARVYMAGILIWWAWKHERERGHPLFTRWQGIRAAGNRKAAAIGTSCGLPGDDGGKRLRLRNGVGRAPLS